MTVIVVETIGWVGAALILAAYVMVSLGKWEGRSMLFQLANLIGAIFFVVNSGYNGAYPSATLNVIWSGIAIATMLHMRRKPLPPPHNPEP